MTVLFILLGLLLLLIGWLLWSPIILQVNTNENQYRLRWWGVGEVALQPLPDDIRVHLQVLFWRKDFYPLHPRPRPKKTIRKEEKEKERAEKKPFRKPSWFKWYKVKQLIRTFHVRRFRLNVDTDDYVTNAYLYPVFYFLDQHRGQLSINFFGKNELVLEVDNRIIRIARALLF